MSNAIAYRAFGALTLKAAFPLNGFKTYHFPITTELDERADHQGRFWVRDYQRQVFAVSVGSANATQSGRAWARRATIRLSARRHSGLAGHVWSFDELFEAVLAAARMWK